MKAGILSPITGRANTEQVGVVRSDEIIAIYQRYFGIDISPYFVNHHEVMIMRCLDTGFRFYYPFELEGDASYYALMSAFDWYYHPNRWEHEKALGLMKAGDRVLEVGSGAGLFVKQLLARSIEASGLELNPRGIERAKQQGIELLNERIEDHAVKHPAAYDVVCSFQVLEHVTTPLTFLKSQLECLRPGGKLIVGVPNNDSYIKTNKMDNRVLNMPPHHMGLWALESLKSLENILDVKLREVHYEPLVDGNVSVYAWNKLNNVFLNRQLLTRALWKLGAERLLVPIFSRFSNRIRGNSMLAVFTRPAA